MVQIFNTAGDVLHTSRNLRCILEFSRKVQVESVQLIGPYADGTGILCVRWLGAICTTKFASFAVMQDWVSDRRLFKGVPRIPHEPPR